MNLKLLLSAVVSGSLALIPNVALTNPVWVNLGYSQNNAQLWIDHQSIAKYQSSVSFDMRLEEVGKSTSAKVAAECNTLTFQYQGLVTNNVVALLPNGIEFPIQETSPDSVLGTAIYYACATYQR